MAATASADERFANPNQHGPGADPRQHVPPGRVANADWCANRSDRAIGSRGSRRERVRRAGSRPQGCTSAAARSRSALPDAPDKGEPQPARVFRALDCLCAHCVVHLRLARRHRNDDDHHDVPRGWRLRHLSRRSESTALSAAPPTAEPAARPAAAVAAGPTASHSTTVLAVAARAAACDARASTSAHKTAVAVPASSGSSTNVAAAAGTPPGASASKSRRTAWRAAIAAPAARAPLQSVPARVQVLLGTGHRGCHRRRKSVVPRGAVVGFGRAGSALGVVQARR